MSIIRGPRPDSKFYTVDKSISEDTRLSWGARGLLIFLLGKPDHWEVSVKHLIEQTKYAVGKCSGRDAVRVILQELKQVGYIQTRYENDEAGRIAIKYVVNEVPVPPSSESETPGTENPGTVKPGTANPPLVKKEGEVKKEEGVNNQPQHKTPARKTAAPAAQPPALPDGHSYMPDDFAPTDKHAEYAQENGLDVQDELALFKQKSTDSKWHSATWNGKFSTWLINAKRFKADEAARSAQAGGRVAASNKNAPAPRQRAANGKLLDDQGKPKDYLKGLGEDGYAKF